MPDRKHAAVFPDLRNEMTQQLLNADWASSPLGEIKDWSFVLKHTLSIMLSSNFPMFLIWGRDQLFFCNDACRRNLELDATGKQPFQGRSAVLVLDEVWKKYFAAQVGEVMSSGTATWIENQLLQIPSHGRVREVFWTYSCSPILDETESVKGVLTTYHVVRDDQPRDIESASQAVTLKAVVNNAPLIMWSINRSGIITTSEGRGLKEVGLESGQLVGHSLFEVYKDQPEAVAQVRRALQGETLVEEVQILDRMYETHYSPIRDSSGYVIGVVGISTDMTKRWEADQLHSYLLQLTDALRSLSDPRQIKIVAMETLGRRLNVNRCYYAELTEDGEHCIIDNSFHSGIGSLDGRYRMDDFGKARVATLRTGAVISTTDVANDMLVTPSEREMNLALQIHAYVNVPLVKNNRLLCLLGVNQSSPRLWTNLELTMVHETAERTWAAVERSRAEIRIHRSEALFRSLVEETPVATALLEGEECSVTLANRKMLSIWKRDVSVIGSQLLEILPELADQNFMNRLMEVYRSGHTYTETEAPVNFFQDGRIEETYLDFTLKALRNLKGEVYGILIAAADVTERVKTKIKLQESEHYFRQLTDTVPAIIWISDPQGHCIYLNKHWYELTGQSRQEAEGLGWLNATHPDDRQQAADAYIEASTVRKPFTISYRIRDKHGAYRWARDSGSPKYSASGEFEGFIGTVIDVHEEKLNQEKIVESEHRFRILVRDATAAIALFVGRDLVIENPNQAFVDIVGKGWDIVGKPLREVMPELVTENQPYLKILDDIFTTGKVFSTAGSPVRIERDGVMTERYYNFTYSPLFDARNNVWAILDIAIDVTESIEAKEALNRIYRQSEQQKRLYEAITNNTPDLVYVFNLDYRFIFANHALLKMLERNWENVEGKRLRELGFQQGHADMHEAEIDEVTLTRKPLRGQVSFDHVMIGKRFYDYIMAPVFNENGEVVAIAGTTRDISDIKAAEEAIKQSEKEFKDITEAIPQLVWVRNAAGEATYFNSRWYQLTGAKPENTLGNKWLNWVHPDDLDNVIERWSYARSTATPVIVEYRLRSSEGTYRWIVSHGIPILNNSGTVERWFGTCTDIHERRSFAESLEEIVEERTIELRESNRLLQRSNEELKQFAYVSSHDLQEPLRKIQTFSSMALGKMWDPEAVKAYLVKIDSSAARMTSLIKDVLQFSEVSNAERAFETLNLNTILEQVKVDFELLIQQKRAIIESDRLPEINANRIQIHQLMSNLMGNALKFTDKDPLIRIEYQEVGGHLIRNIANDSSVTYHYIRFSDNGIGFEQEYAEQIFKLFTRLHHRKDYSGTGIGLALCKKIVENHDGFIRATSHKGSGSTFHIYLPKRV